MFQTHGEHERTRVTHVQTCSVGSGYSTPVAFTNQKEATFGYVKMFTGNSLIDSLCATLLSYTFAATFIDAWNSRRNPKRAILVEHQYFGSWRMVNHHYFAEWIYWCHQFAKLVNHQFYRETGLKKWYFYRFRPQPNSVF